MKRSIILTVFFLGGIILQAQDITGQWNGVLSIQRVNYRLVFHINKTAEGYTSTMDSPDQGVAGIPVATTTFDGSKLSLLAPNIGLSYEGELKNDSIVGTLKQNGMVFPLNLKKTEEIYAMPARPQEPKPPYPYIYEDITFENKSAEITLAGTLTMPKEGKNFPAVVLVTGSGGQNRDEELMGHKPFLVIADYLTRNGIAVLRYDDRGVAKSGGIYATATVDDFATDAASAVNYLKTRKEINAKKIGITGHSEGGIIAFMLAGEKNSNLAYIVSMAGMSIPGDSLMRMQRYLISKKMGVSDIQIEQNEKVIDIINSIINKYTEDFISQNIDKLTDEYLPDSLKIYEAAKTSFQQSVKQMMSPEIKSIMNSNPSEALKKIKCPVLALNGEKDLQVPADINLDKVKALVKSPVTIKKYPDLNHLFQHCDTGLPNEYAMIEETISPEVLSDIVNWIKQVVR